MARFRGSNLFAYPAVGKFSRASSAGGRRHLLSNFVNRIVSVAEDCLSPERTFHGCPLMHFRRSFPSLVSVARFRGSFPWLESVCVSSRWKVLSGEFRRRPTALAIKFRKSDRVGRRGLSEPREDFSRLPTYAIPSLVSVARFRRSFPSLVSVARFRRSKPQPYLACVFARSTKNAYSSATCFSRLNLPELPPCPASILMRSNNGF